MSATIIATSPLGTMPNPTISESFVESPAAFAGIPHPTTFVTIATT